MSLRRPTSNVAAAPGGDRRPDPWGPATRPASVGTSPFRFGAGAQIGSYVTVADLDSFEELKTRVLALEGKVDRALTGYKAYEVTLKELGGQYAKVTERLEGLLAGMSGFDARLSAIEHAREKESAYDQRRDAQIDRLERDVKHLEARLREHEINRQKHNHEQEDDARHQPKGFQENDQPANFRRGMRVTVGR